MRLAKTDIEYFEVAAQYVAALQDGHSGFRVPSSFSADLGMFVDLYDGKVLLEIWNPLTYPRAEFPFAIGDELVSLDGRPVSAWMDEFVKFRGFGNPRGARRQAADMLTFRSQLSYPRATEVGETSEAEIINAAGERKTLHPQVDSHRATLHTVRASTLTFCGNREGPRPGKFAL